MQRTFRRRISFRLKMAALGPALFLGGCGLLWNDDINFADVFEDDAGFCGFLQNCGSDSDPSPDGDQAHAESDEDSGSGFGFGE